MCFKEKIQQSNRCECIYTDLTHSGLLLTKSHNDDAVSLADAALGPWCEPRVRLIEDDAMDVLLLPEPAGQTVLMDTLKDEVQILTILQHITCYSMLITVHRK